MFSCPLSLDSFPWTTFGVWSAPHALLFIPVLYPLLLGDHHCLALRKGKPRREVNFHRSGSGVLPVSPIHGFMPAKTDGRHVEFVRLATVSSIRTESQALRFSTPDSRKTAPIAG
jgi:hypothetical protein